MSLFPVSKVTMMIIALALVLSAQAQSRPKTIYMGDTCLGNFTSYTPINDSVYRVIRFSEGIHLFEGFVVRPTSMMNLYFDPEDQSFHLPSGFEFDSLCLFRNFDNIIIATYLYRNRQLIAQKNYHASKLIFSLETQHGIQTSKYFDSKGKITELRRYDPAKRTYLIKSAEEHSVYKTETGNSRFVSVKGDCVVKKFGGKILSKTHYFKGTMKLRDQMTYMDGKRLEFKAYDFAGNLSLQKLYKDDKPFREITFTHTIDSANGYIFHSSEITYPKKQVLWSYTAHNKAPVEYQNGAYKFSHYAKDDSLNVQFVNTDNSGVQSTLLGSGEHYVQTTRFGSYQVIKHFTTMSIPLEEVQFNDYYYSNQYRRLFPFLELNNNSRLKDYLNSEPSWFVSSTLNIDSVFESGRLSTVIDRHRDTIFYYSFENGRRKLSFCNQYLHKAKDQANCGVGLKHLNGRWLNDHRYTDIWDFSLNDRELFHFAEASGYVTIYNWQGNQVMPPTKGIKIDNLVDYSYLNPYYVDQTLADSLKLQYNCILPLENTDDSIFGLVDLSGRFLVRSGYKVTPLIDLYSNRQLVAWLYEDKGKFGYGDWEGHYLAPKYNWIIRYTDNLLLVSDDSGYSLINPEAQPYFKDHFDNFNYRSESNRLVLSRNNKRHKIIDLDNMHVSLELYNDSIVDWGDYKLVYNTTTHLYTLMDNNYDFMVFESYEQIRPLTEQVYIGKDRDHFDFYSKNFSQKTELKADSIVIPVFQINLWDNSFDPVLDDNYYRASAFNANYHEFLLNNKRGLCLNSGDILIPAAYDAIYVDQFNNYYGFNGKDFDFFLYNPIDLSWSKSPLKSFKSYRLVGQLYNSGNVYLLDAEGHILDDYCDDVIQIGDNRYSVKKNGHIQGIIDKKGRWIKHMNDISSLQYESHYILFKDKMNKAGLMNCKMEILLPAEADFITLPQYDRYVWYNLPVELGNFDYYEQLQNIWKLKDLKSGKVLSDTLFYPMNLNRRYSIVRNNHERLAILDSNLNYLRGYIYTAYFEDHSLNNSVFFTSPGYGYDVFDLDFNFRAHLNYDVIRPFENRYMALKNQYTYILDSSLHAIDSSVCLFANRTEKLKPWTNDDSITLYKAYIGKEDYDFAEYDPESDQYISNDDLELIRKTPFTAASLNFLDLIQTLEYDYQTNNIPATGVYFLPSFRSITHQNWRYDHWIQPVFLTSTDDTSRLKYCNYSEFLNMEMNYTLKGFYKQFASYRYSEKNGSTTYVTYFFSQQGALFIALSDLLKPEQKLAFIRLFKSKLIAIDDPDAPCWKVDDPLETYSNSFIINSKGLTFYLEDNYTITISFQELKPLLKPEWADKF